MNRFIIRVLFKILNLPLELRDYIYCRMLHLTCNAKEATFVATAKILNNGTINIGKGSLIMGTLIAEPNARLEIGTFCYVGPDAIIHAHELIEIGNDVQIAHRVVIED